jgi:hypothetical protein
MPAHEAGEVRRIVEAKVERDRRDWLVGMEQSPLRLHRNARVDEATGRNPCGLLA